MITDKKILDLSETISGKMKKAKVSMLLKALTRFNYFVYTYEKDPNIADADGILTNAGALLADESPIWYSRVFCRRWEGLTKSGGVMDAVDSGEYEGSLIYLLNESTAFIRRNMRVMWKKLSNTREDYPDYQERAYIEKDNIAVRADQVTGQVAGQVTSQVMGQVLLSDLMDYCKLPRKRAELQDYCGLSGRSNFREKYLKPLLKSGLIKMTIPDKPNSKNQKYYSG